MASIAQSEVPSSWKHSLVLPIFKSGDHTQPSNYRPISIVPVIAKIVELAVHQQLYDYLSSNRLLSSSQHGFRPRHSTETALTTISCDNQRHHSKSVLQAGTVGNCSRLRHTALATQRWPQAVDPFTGAPATDWSGQQPPVDAVDSGGRHSLAPRIARTIHHISDHILSANDRGEISLLCLLDLSKCFDVIDHAKLLNKLRAHGIDTSRFSAYLNNHTQSVSLTDRSGASKVSSKLPNNIGVFQGSSLGPLLFSVFANDLSLFVGDAVVVQYADDTQLLVSGPKFQLHHTVARLEHVLASLDDWFRSNGLKVNAEKTQLMLLGSRQNLRTVPHFTVKFRDHSLIPCSEARNLGLVFDHTLSWNSHVALVSKRCFGMLTGLSHLKHSLPAYVLITLVNALVLSQVRYCLSGYGNGSKLNTSRLQKKINFAAKLIFGRKKYDHVSDLHKRLGWLSAADLGRLHTITLTHKILRSGEPDSLACVLRTVGDVHSRPTRQDSDLFVPRSRTEMGKRRFSIRAPTLYNSLPSHVRQLPMATFPRQVKRFLQDSGQ